MKKGFLFALFMLFAVSCFSQDYIFLKNGWVSVVVLEVTSKTVKYRLFSDSTKKVYTEDIADVSEIMYQDGRQETFTETKKQSSDTPVANSNNRSRNTPPASSSQKPAKTEPEVVRPYEIPYTEPEADCRVYVYLKNGRTVEGTIVELEPETSVKIKTTEGRLFAYRMSEVERISQEEIVRQPAAPRYREPEQPRYREPAEQTYRQLPESAYRDSPEDDYEEPVEKKRPWGYRGFVEFAGGGIDHAFGGFSTSHGVQFGPYFFVGAGLGCIVNIVNEEAWALASFFLDLRYNVLDYKVSPFLDVKTGWQSAGDDLYLDPNLGVSFLFTRYFALNLSVGYLYTPVKVRHDYHSYYERINIGDFNFKIGLEW